MHLWANAYAVKNRVNFSHLEENQLCLDASDIPLSEYLPSHADMCTIRSRVVVVVTRIIAEHIPHFHQYYDDTIVNHIEHQYSEESSKQSAIVRNVKTSHD